MFNRRRSRIFDYSTEEGVECSTEEGEVGYSTKEEEKLKQAQR